MIVNYPVLLTEIYEGYLIEVPDLLIFTQSYGNNRQKAINVARNKIAFKCISILQDGLYLPLPSGCVNLLSSEFWVLGVQSTALIEVDLLDYAVKIGIIDKLFIVGKKTSEIVGFRAQEEAFKMVLSTKNEVNEYDSTCGVPDDELSRRFIEAVRIDKEIKKIKGLPISGYDKVNKRAYLEYPDGHKEYV